jgi:hypothetical protein
LNRQEGAQAGAQDGTRRIVFATIPAVLTLALDVLWRANSGFAEFSALMFLLDFMIVLCAAVVILNLQKRLVMGTVAVTGLALYLYAVAWAKYAVLGEPPKVTDIGLIPEFYNFYGPWAFAAILAPGLVLTGILAWNLRFNPRMLGFVVLPLVGLFQLAPYAISTFDLSRGDKSGHHYFPLPLLMGQYGAFLHSAVDHKVRKLKFRQIARNAGAAAEDADLFIDRPLGVLGRRNVHVLMIESLVDPANIGRFKYSEDPVTPGFRAWMTRSASRSYSPVIGNRSPDAHFEVLCGVSAALDLGQVVFSALPFSGIDCLPAKLRAQGWTTMVTNPVDPNQFNMKRTYGALGFQQAYFRGDFPLDDLDGSNPSDAALYRRNLEIVAAHKAAGRHVFNFVLTTSTHYPFQRDETRRPDLLSVSPANAAAHRYGNGVRYATASAAHYVEALRELDPDALILVLGDHAPPLGPETHYASARQGGLQRHETPLVIFDGRRGIIPIGRVPHYALAEFIADRLTGGGHCAARECVYQGRESLRPTMWGSFVFDRHGAGGRFCPHDGAGVGCKAVRRTTLAHLLRAYSLIGIGQE